MMRHIFAFCFVAALLTLFSCDEDNSTAPVSDRLCVIVSDFDKDADVMVRMVGTLKSQIPEMDIEYIQTKNFDIHESAYIFNVAAESYPAGTYFLGIVEPGADIRRIVMRADDGKIFILPDNGVGTRVFLGTTISDKYFIDKSSLAGNVDTQTGPFEIIYANALINIARGTKLSSFGESVQTPLMFDIQQPEIDNGTAKGEILFTDNFGNCITNITADFLSGFSKGDIIKAVAGDESFFIYYGETYASVALHENVMFLNGNRNLELSCNYGNISERYGLKSGSKISLSKEKIKVGLLQYNSSAVSDDIIATLRSRLEDIGLTDNYLEVIHKNANGVTSNFRNLIDELLAEKIDIIIPVSTPSAVAALQYTPLDIPIIYTYITDPQSAGLIGKRKLITGLSDATNFSELLAFVSELMGSKKKVGRIFNAAEPNSAYAQQELNRLGSLYGLSYEDYSINEPLNKDEIQQWMLASSSDAFLAAADNTVSSIISDLSLYAIECGKPLIGDSYEHAKAGALAAISVNYDELARISGDYVKSVIFGISPDDLPIKYLSTNVISVNKTTAAAINFTIPQNILTNAVYIYE